MLKFVNGVAMSYEQRAMSQKLLKKSSKLIAHRPKLTTQGSKLVAHFANFARENFAGIIKFCIFA